MRRDANFGIGNAEIQVKEEKETDINFVSGIAEIQFPLHSIFR